MMGKELSLLPLLIITYKLDIGTPRSHSYTNYVTLRYSSLTMQYYTIYHKTLPFQ